MVIIFTINLTNSETAWFNVLNIRLCVIIDHHIEKQFMFKLTLQKTSCRIQYQRTIKKNHHKLQGDAYCRDVVVYNDIHSMSF